MALLVINQSHPFVLNNTNNRHGIFEFLSYFGHAILAYAISELTLKKSLNCDIRTDNITFFYLKIRNKIRGAVVMERKKNMLKWDLNFYSVAVGFLLALCLFLALGAAGGNNNRGRYECCAAGTDELAVFVIDTQTGQTWRLGRNSSYDFGTPQSPRSSRKSIMPVVE